MKHLKYILMLFFLLYIVEGHAQSWVYVNPALGSNRQPVVEVLTSNSKQFIFKVQIPGFYNTQKEQGGIVYNALEFEEFQTLSKTGEPALPVLSQLIGLPSGAGCRWSMKDSVWTDVPMTRIYPYQTPLLETQTTGKFIVNDAVYQNSVYPSDLGSISEPGYWNGIKNVNLVLCPFRYKPLTNTLSVLKEFTVVVDFTTMLKSDALSASQSATDTEMAEKALSNYNSELIQTYRTAARSAAAVQYGNYDYLIIAAPVYIGTAPLVNFNLWKRQKGFNTKIVSTATTGKTNSSIKSYIQNEYKKGIKYVLFIGNNADIPLYYWSYKGQSSKSDYWYGCMDGENDLQADIAIGRFCVNSLTELANVTNKSMTYERSPYRTDTWYLNNLLVAHNQDAPGKYQGCMEEVRTATYSIVSPKFIKAYGASTAKSGTNATNQTVVSQINAGAGIVNYRGHGGPPEWWAWDYNNASFTATHVNQLTNTSKTPVVFSIACQNANITSSPCLLESFSNGTKGSVAFLGATEDSYTAHNHIFNKYLFKTIYSDGVYNIGKINNLSHIKNLSYYSNSEYAAANAFAYLWGGDPSLEIWTGPISTFNSTDIFRTRKRRKITVDINGVSGCRITAMSTNGSYYSSVENQSYVEFENVVFPCYVTVTKHNYIPSVVYYSDYSDVYIQNQTISTTSVRNGKNFYIGSDVTTGTYGKVTVSESANLELNSLDDTLIKNDFEVKQGAVLRINPE